MNAHAFPFTNSDFTKFMADFDPAKMTESFVRAPGDFKMPEANVKGLMKTQRKNVCALSTTNKTAVASFRAIAERQVAFFHETFEAANAAAAVLGKVKSPEEADVKQADLLKSTYEKALANSTELAGLAAKTGADATETIYTRFAESLNELKTEAVKLKKNDSGDV